VSGAILSLNAGSSSIKFALFEAKSAAELAPCMRGSIKGIGRAPRLTVHDDAGRRLVDEAWPGGEAHSHDALLARLLGWIEDRLGHGALLAAGHRVVHGGRDYRAPVVVTDEVMARLDALCPLAPLHQPYCLAAIRAMQAHRPGLRQIACFDTAFHRDLPAVARRFALPREFEEEGVQRYGFHGLSYEYIAHRLAALDPDLARARVVVAHLGNGASLCAMRAGRSVDTTMSFTALDGLVMGTRSGSLDPGVLLYLLQQKGWTADRLEQLLYERSGLLGVSGISGDMEVLLASDNPHAAEAIDLFVHRVTQQTAALAASLGGIDGFIFTAGIGENSADIRKRVCDRLTWLGVRIDEDLNSEGSALMSVPDSVVKVRTIPTDEERMIALHVLQSCRL
jgi:acetate kinase